MRVRKKEIGDSNIVGKKIEQSRKSIGMKHKKKPKNKSKKK